MCHYVKGNKRRRQRKVWKVVEVHNGEYYSPYVGCKLPSESRILVETLQPSGVKFVQSGIHASSNLKSARQHLKILLNVLESDLTDIPAYKIITGTIPHGTTYYCGVDSLEQSSIVSEKIIWDE